MKANHDAKVSWIRADAARQAERLGVPLNWPAHHPQRTVHAMRLLVGLDDVRPLARELYRAYWVDGEDLTDRGVLRARAAMHGVDADRVLADPAVKQALFDNTAEAASRGAFGVPTFVLEDGTVFWGVDRLPQVREALGLPAEQHRAMPRGDAPTEITFFHDFASPYSYLGVSQVGSEIEGIAVRRVPILLGAMFKQLGGPNVPMLGYAPVRQAYAAREMAEVAARVGVPFKFPSRFPIRSVTALRVAIAEPAATTALYRAAWGEDRDISDDDVVAAVLDAAGFDGEALLVSSREPLVKAVLRSNTQTALDAGVFGVPSWRIGGNIYWGQDRLWMVQEAAQGWVPANG
jgi:2-hydroxychromene-2-carboxylate isomerase